MQLSGSDLPEPFHSSSLTAMTALLTSKAFSKGVPRATHKPWSAFKTLQLPMFFNWFYYFVPVDTFSYYRDQSLKTCGSKQALRAVWGNFWRSNERPEVVILLMTSFKNWLFKQCASKTSSTALLKGFWTALSLQIRPKTPANASHEPWFWSSWSFQRPKAATMTLQKGWRTDVVLILTDTDRFLIQFMLVL